MFFSVAVWLVLIYGFRIALFGNPLAKLLGEADVDFLGHIDMVTKHNGPYTEESVHFLRRFSRLSLLELGAFLLETGLLIYLIITNTLLFLAVLLLIKNVVMFVLSLSFARRRRREMAEDANFRAMKNVPEWVHTCDRLSSLASALGFAFIFAHVNGWM